MTASAPTVPCAKCGAPLPVDPALDAVTCASCATVTPVSAELRERARAYRVDVEGAHAQEKRAGDLDTFYDNQARYARPWIRWSIVLAFVVTFWLLLLPSGGATAVGAYVDAGVLAFTALTVARFLSFTFRAWGWTGPGAGTASVSAPCSACGADVRFVEGETTARCRACGATVTAPASVAAALARGAHERAKGAQSVAKESEGKAWAAASDINVGLYAFAIVGIVIVLVVGTIIVLMNDVHLPAQPTFGPGALALWLLAAVGAGVAWALVRRGR